MKRIILFTSLLLLSVSLFAKELTPIPLDEFKDLIHHGLMKYKDEKAPYDRWTEKDVKEIADNLLVFQNPDGGWGKIGKLGIFKNNPDFKNVSFQDILVKMPDDVKKQLTEYLKNTVPVKYDSIKTEGSTKPSDKIGRPRSVLDNTMTYSHVRYLTLVYNQTKEKKYLKAAQRGLKWILSVQLPCGGWSGCDVYGLCNNDEVTSGVLSFLQDILYDEQYKVLLKGNQKEIQKAHDDALAILLKTQVEINGKKTIWAHNYDPDTLEPIPARPFEPAALTAMESYPIVLTLMREKNKSPELIEAIKAAADFLASDAIYVTGTMEIKDITPFTENNRYIDKEKFFTLNGGDNQQKYLVRFLSIPECKPLYGDWFGHVFEDFNQLPVERKMAFGFLTYYDEGKYKKLKAEAERLSAGI